MYLYGSFVTQLGETVTVHIVTGGDRSTQIEIGGEGSSVAFPADSPVEIQSSVNDTFDHLLRSEASIRLQTRDFIPGLFCNSCLDAVVNIFKDDKCVFAGFIEPQAYSQGYNEVYDELEISCVDALSALQNLNYRNVGSAGTEYGEVKINAGQRKFYDILSDIMEGICTSLNLTGDGRVKVYYDGSIGLTPASGRYDILSQLEISELLFLGDDEDNVWKQDEVLTEMLKYLNLHIVQEGLNFYIFSWNSVKASAPIIWKELTTGETVTPVRNSVKFDNTNVASDDTTISIGEVYNQLLLTCKLENVDNLIKSPLDDDSLTSPYTWYQKYMTEIISEGQGLSAYEAFYYMTHGAVTNFEGAVTTDWYLRVRNNSDWIFPEALTGKNLISEYCRNNTNQQLLPNQLYRSPGAAIVSFGKIEKKADLKDNSPVSKIDMEDYLAVSVNGNGVDTAEGAYPTEASLQLAAPVAFYQGSAPGAVYSPADKDTVNYIVLSGKIILNPLMAFTDSYKALHDAEHFNEAPWVDSPLPGAVSWWHKTVPSRNNGDGRYYTQQYFKAQTPRADLLWDEDTTRGLVPFTGTGPQQYEFKYSAIGDDTDTVSKVAVLACMLIVGDQCVVETGKQGQISDFEWRTFKERSECATDDEYYQQSFTIGFDPKIGDKLIGTEFDFQNNIDYTLGLDAEGIAIPIKQSDKLSGKVRFMILGPVNTLWGEVTRRHRTFFRRTKWAQNNVPLLAHVSSIFLKSFEVKVYSDNGLIEPDGDNDIVYISDTREDFVNRKGDIEFKINSALTREEREQLGVGADVSLSIPRDISTGTGLLSVYDFNRQLQAKPEQLYVDSYYSEYHAPRVQMVQKLIDLESVVGLFNHYVHPAMPGKQFFVQGISRNLIEGYAELNLKEIEND